jgi:hypothetical protein
MKFPSGVADGKRKFGQDIHAVHHFCQLYRARDTTALAYRYQTTEVTFVMLTKSKVGIDQSHMRFVGNLTLNLHDCGGQIGFMESYLSSERDVIFTNVAVLIFIFDVTSEDLDVSISSFNNFQGS